MAGPKENPPAVASPLKEGGDTASLDKNAVQLLNSGEKAEEATGRLVTVYVAKAKEEDSRGQKTLAQATEDGRKAGLKVSYPNQLPS